MGFVQIGSGVVRTGSGLFFSRKGSEGDVPPWLAFLVGGGGSTSPFGPVLFFLKGQGALTLLTPTSASTLTILQRGQWG